MFFKKKAKIDFDNLPNHIALICDGNRRWAKGKGLPTLLGHKEAIKVGQNIAQKLYDIGVKNITFFCMSTENFKRSEEEVAYLIDLFKGFLAFKKCLRDKGYRFQHVGDRSYLSKDVLKVIDELSEATKDCTFGTMYFAFGYGGRNDIVNATKKILNEKVDVKNLNEETFKDYLSTKSMPDVDLLIRTGGEERLSGFLLYNMAYAELCFLKKYWPELTPKDIENCVIEYQKRNRRFGK